jgi:tripartite-type tricarboxylate transporter receptor subunit TctC
MRFALRLCVLIAGAILLSSARASLAQEYPAREIRTICPFAPGTGADIIVRFYASKLAEIAGKPVITENRAGAQGLLGTEAVAHAKPDGYTISINPSHPPWRPRRISSNICHSIRSRTSSSAAR